MKLLVAFLLLFSTSVLAEKVSMTTGEWPPFISSQLKHYGYISDITTKAFEHQGYTVSTRFTPWKRALKLAEMGSVDVSFAWYKNEERLKLFYYSDAILKTSHVFFHRESLDFDWTVVEDLKGLVVVGSIGYQYTDAFNQAAADGLFSFVRAANNEQAMKMIAAGRADIFPINIQAGYAIVRKEMGENGKVLTHHPRSLSQPISSHLVVAKKHPKAKEIIEAFNKGLAELISSGQYLDMEKASQQGKYEP